MDLEDLRLLVYRAFVTDGRAPDTATLAGQLGGTEPEVRAGLRTLAAARHVVLDEQDRIVMAHPFATVPLGFSVMGRNTLWWGGCAWDSFALPHLLPEEGEVLVATRCRACGRPHAWNVGHETPPAGEQVAHFLVPAAHIWDDVVHSCANQRIFCDLECVDNWLAATDSTRGYVMDLPQLWRFAQGWYAGRLDRGYLRREPTEAKDYLRSVGLSGEFWGL